MKKPVLVVGGGIAGIQASLDLAEMGIPVFIVENSPSIGGRMAQLDKTFPTNDCSACILAPKVTSCYNHPLIKTLTWSDLLEVKGDAPDFTAVIRKKARFIDEELCKGCNDCTLKCPVEAKSEFDMGVGKRCAVYKPFAQAVPNKVVIDKKGTSPCKYRCPAHMDAHGYVSLTGQGRYEEALAVVRRTTPLAGVLGRVCFHPCEENCSRQYVESPIAIAGLKRFIADYEIMQGKTPALQSSAEKKNEKIAIIGSGPAGLNCAFKLALEGYPVTIFEALPAAGGMLKVGIPDYRLDKDVLEREIQIIKDLGVDIRLNTPVGRDLTFDDLRAEGFKAFFLAIGAHSDMKLGIPGEELDGVISGVEFLRDVNLRDENNGICPQGELNTWHEANGISSQGELSLWNEVKIGKKVLVVGGGNVAMDAARTAVRLGCDVTVVYRRTEKEMPANIWEIEHAKEEGVKFEFLTTPVEVVPEGGKTSGLKCIRNRLGQPDSSGRRRPVPIEGSEFVIPADTILTAIGQSVETDLIKAAGGECFDRKGRIACNEKSMLTSIPDIFAGGDAVTGPATVIEAIAAGNKAAKSIINYLEGTGNSIEPFLLPETPIEDISFKGYRKTKRTEMPVIDLKERIGTFREVELGFDEERAKIEALRCVDCSICCECKACELTCQAKAIRHEQQDEIIEIPVSSVIMANGFDPADNIGDMFGYGSCPDIVTSMEYERILSASGPYKGHVQRPSDGKAPERIAFIQCVGSRDYQCGNGYCSSVCCMYAVKEAMITKEHLPTVKDIDIFYMDMRSYGKDFDKYIDSARNKYKIGFIRSRVADITANKKTGSVTVRYSSKEDGMSSDDYDMVVLSVGLNAKKEIQPLLEKTGIKTDKFGFCWVNEMNAPQTSREGISACGAAAGPKDIPETVVEASAAASEASKAALKRDVSIADYSHFFKEEEEMQYRDVSKEPIRIGVFVCHCGVNIGGYLDVSRVVEYARTLPFVEYADHNLYTCSVDAQKVIIEKIKEYNLNRVVVASCTPRTHESLFQSVLAKSGLNPYLFTMANIRDQCSWVHMDRYADATSKAKDLVRMAVGKATFARQLTKQKIEVNKAALVIGGGMAGISAALELAGMGYRVFLAERSVRLGGNALNLNISPSGRNVGAYVEEYVTRVVENPLIDVYLNTEIKNIDGYVGKFTTVLGSNGQETEIKHGVVIVATGAKEYKPEGFLYGAGGAVKAQGTEGAAGADSRVITQMELEHLLKDNSLNMEGIRNITMIQCVGSRSEERPYCSRVCCNQAIRNALVLKQKNKDVSITILYRDIRSYGMSELKYREARKTGISFVRYEDGSAPGVEIADGKLMISSFEPILKQKLYFETDLLILSSAIIPDTDENKRIAQMLKVPLNQESFFLEAHAKLRPVDFATEGVYLCGLAHAPKTLKESIVQGKAAAARAATVISKDMLETEGTIAQVSEMLCTGCATCEKVCAYKAISMKEVKKRDGTEIKASINAVLCKGCGTCSAACRCGAIDVNGFADRQVISEIECLLCGV